MRNDTTPIEHRQYTLPSKAVVHSAAWRVGQFFVGKATVKHPSGAVLGRLITATGCSLDDVHEQLLQQVSDVYRDP